MIERIAQRPDDEGRVLADDQVAALTAAAVSGRTVDVLVGSAGAGKTTAMNALRRAWEAEHGAGSVVGLAPSAAAQVLADDLGIATENTAKWLHDHTVQGHTVQGLSFRAIAFSDSEIPLRRPRGAARVVRSSLNTVPVGPRTGNRTHAER